MSADLTAAFDAKSFVDSLPARPGVYRMLDERGEIIYVGKARSLKSRVSSYFQASNVHPKVQALVAKTAAMQVTITSSDTEALLLEFNLIKKHRPRFNVVLRDDKSFPYLHFDTEHEFPRLTFYRGSRKEPGRFFGPYPSANGGGFLPPAAPSSWIGYRWAGAKRRAITVLPSLLVVLKIRI